MVFVPSVVNDYNICAYCTEFYNMTAYHVKPVFVKGDFYKGLLLVIFRRISALLPRPRNIKSPENKGGNHQKNRNNGPLFLYVSRQGEPFARMENQGPQGREFGKFRVGIAQIERMFTPRPPKKMRPGAFNAGRVFSHAVTGFYLI